MDTQHRPSRIGNQGLCALQSAGLRIRTFHPIGPQSVKLYQSEKCDDRPKNLWQGLRLAMVDRPELIRREHPFVVMKETSNKH